MSTQHYQLHLQGTSQDMQQEGKCEGAQDGAKRQPEDLATAATPLASMFGDSRSFHARGFER